LAICPLTAPISPLMTPVAALPKELKQPHVAPPEQALARLGGLRRRKPISNLAAIFSTNSVLLFRKRL
jgi:hypothetical protein